MPDKKIKKPRKYQPATRAQKDHLYKWAQLGQAKPAPVLDVEATPTPIVEDEQSLGFTLSTAAPVCVPASPSSDGLKGDQARAFSEITARISSGATISKLVGYAGCLSGDTILNINRGGKGFQMALRDVVDRSNGVPNPRGRPWDTSIPTRIARADGGVIRLCNLKNAWCSGMKETFLLCTDSGRTIRATSIHPFLTETGRWVELGKLSIGDILQVNAGRSKKGRTSDPDYKSVRTEFHPCQVYKGQGASLVRKYYAVPEHRAVVEAAMNDLTLSQFLWILCHDEERASRLSYLSATQLVHHKNDDTLDNSLLNLEVVEGQKGHGDHHQWTKNVLWQVGFETILSIEPWGEEMTYDIEVEDAPHNFLANGFVVHNTGKTWLLARIAQWAVQQGYIVTVAAPTHKAAGVIKSKMGDLAGVEVRTIHSLLGLKLEPDFTNDTGGRVLKSGDGKSKLTKGLVICDEASMVGSILKEHIDACPDTVHWLFVGDLAQLPPVGESVSELLDEPDSTLEEVLRQAKGSEILNLATRIRGGDLGMAFEQGKDVFQVASAEELFQAALLKFRSEEYQKDASHARMLVFRNARRQAINTRMRQLVTGIGPEQPYVPGEWLVMYSAFSPEKSRLNVLAEHAKGQQGRERSRAWAKFYEYKEQVGPGSAVAQLHVSEEVRVETVQDGQVQIGEWSFAVHRVTCRTKGDEVYELPVLRADQVERHQAIMTEQAMLAREARKEQEEHKPGSEVWCEAEQIRKDAWSKYFILEETFASVDYAYAMTVHKSQGSTFDHVFVDVPDLLSSGGMQGRILYTSVTRPSKTLTFYK